LEISMLIVRYQKENQVRFGHLEDERIGPLTHDPFADELARGPLRWNVAEVTLLAPCQPSKIIGLVYNFVDRVREQGRGRPNLPTLFLKPPSSVIGPGEAILLPLQSHHVEYGAELGVVIGRRARHVAPEEAGRYVLGYTCANDVTARDLIDQDELLARGKSFDTFCALGPAIATQVDPTEVVITCVLNGQTRQMSSTHDMLFKVPQVVAFVSAVMTLLPGDVILMGSPAGAGPLADGDVVEVEIEGIGKLRNTVKAEEN
jgi:2-keto-4-pentenoate hydratase/2-oxohepta-3-ene-1,7-dioic acid hydratase in catechol pathway